MAAQFILDDIKRVWHLGLDLVQELPPWCDGVDSICR
jgi:hypothetical protein